MNPSGHAATLRWSWLPNAICLVRMALVAPLVWVLLNGDFAWALALVVLAGLSDGLDGFLAKTFGWRSRVGGLLDPLADKFFVVSAFLVLTWLAIIPLALTLIVVVRDAIIVVGAVAYQWRVEPLHGEPLLISKLNTACQLLFLLATLTLAAFHWPSTLVWQLLGAALVVTSITSGLAYVLRWGGRARRHWQEQRR